MVRIPVHANNLNLFISALCSLSAYLLYLPALEPRAPPASVLKCGVSVRGPGATETASLGEVELMPLAPPSRLLSPKLGDFRARHASATTESEREREREGERKRNRK